MPTTWPVATCRRRSATHQGRRHRFIVTDESWPGAVRVAASLIPSAESVHVNKTEPPKVSGPAVRPAGTFMFMTEATPWNTYVASMREGVTDRTMSADGLAAAPPQSPSHAPEKPASAGGTSAAGGVTVNVVPGGRYEQAGPEPARVGVEGTGCAVGVAVGGGAVVAGAAVADAAGVGRGVAEPSVSLVLQAAATPAASNAMPRSPA